MLLNLNYEALMFYSTYIGYALAGMGLIYFIVFGILKNNFNYVFKSFIYFIVGGTLTILFALALFIDYTSTNMSKLGFFPYIVFISTNLVYTLSFGLYNLIKGKKRYQKLSFKKVKPTVNRNIKQHVYLIYKCGNQIILDCDKNGSKGFVLEMDKKHLFKDELINSFNKKNNVNVRYDDLKELGVITVNGKKPDIYYSYLIEITSIPEELKNKQIIDAYEIVTLTLADLDKQIILRTLMREPFNLYL